MGIQVQCARPMILLKDWVFLEVSVQPLRDRKALRSQVYGVFEQYFPRQATMAFMHQPQDPNHARCADRKTSVNGFSKRHRLASGLDKQTLRGIGWRCFSAVVSLKSVAIMVQR